MDDRNHSVSPESHYPRLGSHAAPIIVDVRRDADIADAGMPAANALHCGRCSFDAIVRISDNKDPALDHLATIVRGADTCRHVNSNLWGGTRIFFALIAFTGVASVGPRASAQDSATNVAIERQAIGASPRGFDLPQGQWTVVDDATAAAGVAIEQSGVRTTGEGFQLAIYRPALVENAEVSVRLNAARGTSEQGGGLAIRLSSPRNYYLAELDALRNRVLFSLVRNGVREEIVAVDADVASRTWHTVTIRAMDDEFAVSLDGTWMFTGFDKTLSQPGNIALWTKGDSVTRFDSMAITRLWKPEQAHH